MSPEEPGPGQSNRAKIITIAVVIVVAVISAVACLAAIGQLGQFMNLDPKKMF